MRRTRRGANNNTTGGTASTLARTSAMASNGSAVVVAAQPTGLEAPATWEEIVAQGQTVEVAVEHGGATVKHAVHYRLYGEPVASNSGNVVLLVHGVGSYSYHFALLGSVNPAAARPPAAPNALPPTHCTVARAHTHTHTHTHTRARACAVDAPPKTKGTFGAM